MDVSVLKTIKDREILDQEMIGTSFKWSEGNKRDGEGKIKAEGFRHVAYWLFHFPQI